MTNLGKHIAWGQANYEKAMTFSLNKKNRAYNPSHLEKIKRQMIDCLDIMPPITVNMITNHIVEGQHRHKSYITLMANGVLPKDAVIGVKYVEIPEENELEAIIRANNNSKGWTLENYVASSISSDIVAYVTLDNWCKSHSLTSENGKAKVRYGCAIIKGKRCAPELKKGTFTITDEELQRAEAVHAEMVEIIDVLELKPKGMTLEGLAVSWIKVREQHDFRMWMEEFKKRKSKYQKMDKDNSREWDAIFAQANLNIDLKK